MSEPSGEPAPLHTSPTKAPWRRAAAPWRRAAAAGVLLLCLLIFFRDALLDGLHHLYGDNYDGLIEVAILDHWFRVVSAGDAWSLTGYFHPYPATLGYNDTLVVPAIPFVLARWAGADPFLAAFLAHVTMKAVGFAGMYVLLRRGMQVRTWLALAGAAVFALANASLLHMYHAQLLAVGLLPWLGVLALAALRAVRDQRRGRFVAAGSGFAVLYGLAAFSAFYGIWFFSLFLILATPLALLFAPRGEARAFVLAAPRQWRALACCACVAAVALMPLLWLYLPKLRAGAHHDWASNVQFLPTPVTLFDVGAGNLVWGRLFTALGVPLPGGETQFGIPLILMGLTLCAMVWARRERGATGALVLATGLAIVVLVVLALRWPDGRSAWWYLYRFVPGAAAVRVVSRMLLFALAGIVAIVFVFLDRAPRPAWATALIVAGLLVEQMQTAAPLALDRGAAQAMLASTGPPPPACSAFFVVSARPADYPVMAEARAINRAWGGGGGTLDGPRYRHNVDAMLLATFYGRPTVNGYASFNPPDWQFADPNAPDYLNRVRRYARRHRLHDLCGLDARRRPMWFRLGGAFPA